MKTLFLLSLLALSATGGGLRVGAQNYSLDWGKVAGGGGTSTGGVYTVSGTIGQADASTAVMSGGNFTLTGGFWSILAVVQSEGAPTLTISMSPTGQLVVSWPESTTGWVLEWSPSVNGVNSGWKRIDPSSYQLEGTQLKYYSPEAGGNQYYRLHKVQ